MFTDPSPLFAGEPPSLMLAHLVTPFKEGMGPSLKKRPKASAILTIQPGSIRYRSLYNYGVVRSLCSSGRSE